MGIFSGIKAIWDIQRLSKGGTAKLSLAQITSVIINLPDARKNLKRDEFEQVYALYKSLQKCKSKIPMGLEGYYDTSARLILMFDQLAPYQLYGGRSEIESEFLLSEVRRLYKDDPNFAEEIISEIKKSVIDSPGETISEKKWRKSRLIHRIVIVLLILSCCGAQMNLSYTREQLSYEQEQALELQAQAEKWEENYNKMKASRDSYRDRFNATVDELDFWGDYAVIVTENGEKYHTYGCQYIKGRSFWIYNVEAAISRGYEPCSVCEPPRR